MLREKLPPIEWYITRHYRNHGLNAPNLEREGETEAAVSDAHPLMSGVHTKWRREKGCMGLPIAHRRIMIALLCSTRSRDDKEPLRLPNWGFKSTKLFDSNVSLTCMLHRRWGRERGRDSDSDDTVTLIEQSLAIDKWIFALTPLLSTAITLLQLDAQSKERWTQWHKRSQRWHHLARHPPYRQTQKNRQRSQQTRR